MEFLQPRSWAEALAAKADQPSALPIIGGTDVMVEMNFDRRRPDALLDLSRVRELQEWGWDERRLRIGAAVTYTRIIEELGSRLRGLAIASRTVGSPQIRNRGTVGGNLGSASPAGDAHPPLLAADALIELASVRGVRQVPVSSFYVGVKRNALEPDELIAAFLIRPADGPQQFSKIGTRNAMVVAVASFALTLRRDDRTVRTGIGSAAPTPLRALEAEAFLQSEMSSRDLWDKPAALGEATVQRFGQLVMAAASPINDIRGTAAYRTHALAVMARRTLSWAWDDYRRN
jgi:CO/xanthine dehydrogenase FAD-binding subunit